MLPDPLLPGRALHFAFAASSSVAAELRRALRHARLRGHAGRGHDDGRSRGGRGRSRDPVGRAVALSALRRTVRVVRYHQRHRLGRIHGVIYSME